MFSSFSLVNFLIIIIHIYCNFFKCHGLATPLPIRQDHRPHRLQASSHHCSSVVCNGGKVVLASCSYMSPSCLCKVLPPLLTPRSPEFPGSIPWPRGQTGWNFSVVGVPFTEAALVSWIKRMSTEPLRHLESPRVL